MSILSNKSRPDAWTTDSSAAGTITGAINGVNTVFTLSVIPVPNQPVFGHQNGLFVVPGGVHYTISGKTVTFVTAPPIGADLAFVYRTA